MDFSSIDIQAFLKAAMPVRFADISPYEFEQFTAELFRADGYDVEETNYSGDFGADLVLTRKGEKTVVQVKRYANNSVVGVSDVNQAVGAKEYYHAQQALMVTTSSFSASAVELAKKTGVLLWDWSRLEQYINNVFLEGEDYHAFFEQPAISPDEAPEMVLHYYKVKADDATSAGSRALCLHMGLENKSGRNMHVLLDLPILVTREKRQVRAVEWKQDYFFHGLLISEATAEIGCLFLPEQLPEIKRSDRIVLRLQVQDMDKPVVIDQMLGADRGKCYVVTFCYGRDSAQYRTLTTFRDEVLLASPTGQLTVRLYYALSPPVIDYVASRKPGWRIMQISMHAIIQLGLFVASFPFRVKGNSE